MDLENDAEVAYARLGALSQAIKNELQNDLKIHDAAILPAFCNLPQITAAEYSTVSITCLSLPVVLSSVHAGLH